MALVWEPDKSGRWGCGSWTGGFIFEKHTSWWVFTISRNWLNLGEQFLQGQEGHRYQNTRMQKKNSWLILIQPPRPHHTQSALIRSTPSDNHRISTALYVHNPCILFPSLWHAIFHHLYTKCNHHDFGNRGVIQLQHFKWHYSCEHLQELQPKFHFLSFLKQLIFFNHSLK